MMQMDDKEGMMPPANKKEAKLEEMFERMEIRVVGGENDE